MVKKLKTGKQLYDLYKGKFANIDRDTGIVCGYDAVDLVIAVTSGEQGWEYGDEGVVKMTHSNNPKGYLFVTERNVLNKKEEII